MSLLLSITTSTRCSGCALWGDAGPMGSVTSVAAHRHAEFLMPAIDGLCRSAGVGPQDLSAVVVDIGPGLFTGLRVGISTANSIALARGIPVIGVTSVEVLAHPHRRAPGVIAAVVDARRSEVYWATYGRGSDGAWGQLSEPVVSAAEVLAEHLGSIEGPVLAVGDGAHRYLSVIEGVAEVGPATNKSELWPCPLVLAELGAATLAGLAMQSPGGGAGPARPGALAEALYLRQADVRIGWDQVDGRVAPVASPGG